MKKLLEAAQKAKQDTAAYMTADVRNRALNDGWHPAVVSTLRIEHGKDGFQTKVNDEHAAAAFKHEFGDEHTRPSATVRKYANDSHASAQAFMASLNKHFGGKF